MFGVVQGHPQMLRTKENVHLQHAAQPDDALSRSRAVLPFIRFDVCPAQLCRVSATEWPAVLGPGILRFLFANPAAVSAGVLLSEVFMRLGFPAVMAGVLYCRRRLRSLCSMLRIEMEGFLPHSADYDRRHNLVVYSVPHWAAIDHAFNLVPGTVDQEMLCDLVCAGLGVVLLGPMDHCRYRNREPQGSVDCMPVLHNQLQCRAIQYLVLVCARICLFLDPGLDS